MDPGEGGWRKYFTDHLVAPRRVQQLVLKLHQQKNYSEIVQVLEAAIISGQVQPWMYEVLAATMRASGRPEKDIERVLLSSVDFTATDVQDILFAAGYLHRFGHRSRAIKLYREASRLAPNLPEPYILGLKAAIESKDIDGVEWGASGVLLRAWTQDHTELHRQALAAAAEAMEWLKKSGDSPRLTRFVSAIQLAQQRDLILKVTWTGDADVDLIVEEPLGTVCSFEQRISRGGGVLVHDGSGARPMHAYELYVCPQAAAGDYRATIRVVGGNVVAKQVVLTVIRHAGTPDQDEQTKAVMLAGQETILNITLDKGRRTTLESAALKVTPIPVAQVRQRRNSGIVLAGHQVDAAEDRREFQRRRTVLYQNLAQAGSRAQPVVRFLSEGVTNTATAVVSGDRRYVRIAVSPTFSAITDVFTFTFSGGNP